MKAKDTFKDKMEVLRKFGFRGQSLQKATWRLESYENTALWFAQDGTYLFGVNELSECGERFSDRRDPTLPGASSYGEHGSGEAVRLLFLKKKRFGRDIVEFAGVFQPDPPKSILNVSAWKKVTNEWPDPEKV
jgi:hypothetical protein